MNMSLCAVYAWKYTMSLRAVCQFFPYSFYMNESIRGEKEEKNIHGSNNLSCKSPFRALTSARHFPTQRCCSIDIFSFLGNILCKPLRCLYVVKNPSGPAVWKNAQTSLFKATSIPVHPHSNAHSELQQVVFSHACMPL